MRRILFILLLVVAAAPLSAQDSTRIGKARIFNNDFFGDGQDRWRTGSYAVSIIRGPEWQNALPSRPGQLMEYRLRTEIIAPSNLANPVIGTDRRYVGAVSLGMFTHFSLGSSDVSAGVDLVTTGPQTGMGSFQTWAHTITGDTIPAVLGSQIENGLHPTVNFEIARDFELGSKTRMPLTFRPFVEAQAGVETFVRFGGDLTLGSLGRGDFQVRDGVTGQRVVAVRGQTGGGFSAIIGADTAFVSSSVYLPASSGFVLSPTRLRVRGGVVYETESSSVFYGLTWLGKEFAAQKASQVVGSVSARFRF